MSTGLGLARLALGLGLAAAVVCGRPARAAPAAVDHDGPFGIAMGEPLADLGAVTPVQPGISQVLNPARPNDKLQRVTVAAFPNLGVCRIVAGSVPYDSDANGKLVRALSDQLAVALAQKYGPPTKIDTCSGSDEECQDFWTAVLRRKNAQYSYQWSADKSPLPRGVKSITLNEVAYSEIRTGVVLAYIGVNDDACAAALAAAAAASL